MSNCECQQNWTKNAKTVSVFCHIFVVRHHIYRAPNLFPATFMVLSLMNNLTQGSYSWMRPWQNYELTAICAISVICGIWCFGYWLPRPDQMLPYVACWFCSSVLHNHAGPAVLHFFRLNQYVDHLIVPWNFDLFHPCQYCQFGAGDIAKFV